MANKHIKNPIHLTSDRQNANKDNEVPFYTQQTGKMRKFDDIKYQGRMGVYNSLLVYQFIRTANFPEQSVVFSKTCDGYDI